VGEVAAGHPQKSHEFLYWEFHEGGFKQAVRMGDWKLVRQPFGQNPTAELYNIKNDLGETKNVAAEHKDVVMKIETYLKTARTESNDWPVPRQPSSADLR
jgi:arylsulfatase A-like enzyme